MFYRNVIFSAIKKIQIPQVIREKVWEHHVGLSKGISDCFCCKTRQITPFRFECAHIVPESKGGTLDVSNLLPTCSLCNRSMGETNYYIFKSKILNDNHYNEHKFTDEQKNIIIFYNSLKRNITCSIYVSILTQLWNIIYNTMNIKQIKKIKKNKYIISTECECGYNFKYIYYKNNKRIDSKMNCEKTKQNMIDIICEHIPCLIHKKKFITLSNKLLNSRIINKNKNKLICLD